MKPGSSLLIFLLFFLASCSALPEIVPLQAPAGPGPDRACASPFPGTPRQFLHALEATVAGQTRSGILGLVRVRPRERALRCVIMTLEGLVVFDARLWGAEPGGGRSVIDRALPPFNAPGMAHGILADIEMIFLPPRGELAKSGRLASGERICRYGATDGSVTDVVLYSDGRWALNRYDAGGKLLRSVRVPPGADPHGTPSRLELTARGVPGYRLTMALVEASPIGGDEKP